MTSVIRLLSPWPMKSLQLPVAFRTLPRSPILSVCAAFPRSPVLSRAAFPRFAAFPCCERSAPLPIPAQFQCVSVVPLVPGLVTYTPLLYIPVFTTWTKNTFLPSRFRSQRAQCSPPFASPSVPHSRAALAIQARRVPDRGGHPCEVTRRAEACVTVSDRLQPPDSVGLSVAHRFHFRTRRTRPRP